ncbi:MAG: hypothetical protein N3F67_06295 [Acidilobaceae archaeon]|nr:hypothetical protein [Acidilobaceae archaeon]
MVGVSSDVGWLRYRLGELESDVSRIRRELEDVADIEMIEELEDDIDELREKIREIEERLARIEERLNALENRL